MYYTYHLKEEDRIMFNIILYDYKKMLNIILSSFLK